MAAIYDKLKSIYKYVSDEMYVKRYNIFCQSLPDIQMYFEPLFCFDEFGSRGVSVVIDWWEALARNKNTQKAPVELFNTCELWGLQFQTALDLYCLEEALKSYNKSIQNIRKSDIKRLSVNVYPNTILSAKYAETLRYLLRKDRLIPRDRLTLEISEKTLIAESNEKDYFANFQDSMGDLRRSCWVNFALDDFGVGHSTIQRLHRLLPEYVKIDRDILLQDPHLGKEVIRYLINLTSQEKLKIIIEGFDSSSKITLRELVKELEVQYIQGHLLGKAVPQIYKRLSKEQYEYICQLLE